MAYGSSSLQRCLALPDTESIIQPCASLLTGLGLIAGEDSCMDKLQVSLDVLRELANPNLAC